MDVGVAMLVEGRRQARYCEAFSGNAGTGESERPAGASNAGHTSGAE